MATIQGLIKISPSNRGRIPIDDSSPKAWFTWGDEIVVEPVPDDNYKLALYVSDFPESELTLDSDVPSSLPLEFHECIALFSCYSLLLKRKKWGMAVYYYNRYLSSLEKKYRIYINRKAERREQKQLPFPIRRSR